MATKTNLVPEQQLPQSRVYTIELRQPAASARRVVSKVLARSIDEHRDERRDAAIFSTPGVLEALDAALGEIERLKRSA